MAGQKGLEVLQLSLAVLQVCSSALVLMGRGREGHWAVGRAPRGGDTPPTPRDARCWRRVFLCGSHVSIPPLLMVKRQVATTAETTPVSRGKSSPPPHNPISPLEWGGSPRQLRQQVCATIRVMPGPPPSSSRKQE